MTDWSKLVGHRCLIKEPWIDRLFEVTVLESSPTGRVKFQWESGINTWEERETCNFLEDLGDVQVVDDFRSTGEKR